MAMVPAVEMQVWTQNDVFVTQWLSALAVGNGDDITKEQIMIAVCATLALRILD